MSTIKNKTRMKSKVLSLLCVIFILNINIIGQQSYTPKRDFPSNNKTTGKTNATTFIENRHLYSLYLGYGLSSFSYKPLVGKSTKKTGYNIGIDYSYFWNSNWGLSMGAGLSSYSTTINLNGVRTSSLTNDGDIIDGVEQFYLITNFSGGFTENLKTTTIGIPILFRYRHNVSPKSGFMYGLGPKIAFDLSSKSSVSKGSYSTHGYYPQYSTTTDSLNFSSIQGFGTYAPRNTQTNSLGVAINVLGDIQFFTKLNSAWMLSFGPYFEYQVNKTTSNPDKELVTYDASDLKNPKCVYNPTMNSAVVDGANRLAAGFKVTITYDNAGHKNRKIAQQQQRILQEAQDAERAAKLRAQQITDSLANALRLSELRNKQVADSIALAAKLAEEARKLADLRRLAEEQRIRDSIANAKNVAVIMDIKTKKLSPEELALLKLPIIFSKGSADITSQSKINAQRIGEMLSHHPDLLLKITGHTCDLGDAQVNYRLGLRRAQTLFKEFTQAGVIPQQVTTFSKGETEPLYPNINEDNRQRNRRVVVVIEDEVTGTKKEDTYH